MAYNIDDLYAQMMADPSLIVAGINFTENSMTDGQFFVFSENDTDEGSSSAGGSSSGSIHVVCSQAGTQPPGNTTETNKDGKPKANK